MDQDRGCCGSCTALCGEASLRTGFTLAPWTFPSLLCFAVSISHFPTGLELFDPCASVCTRPWCRNHGQGRASPLSLVRHSSCTLKHLNICLDPLCQPWRFRNSAHQQHRSSEHILFHQQPASVPTPPSLGIRRCSPWSAC